MLKSLKYILVVIICIFIKINIDAQNSIHHKKIELYVDSVFCGMEVEVPVDTLAVKLVNKEWDEEEKVYAIYYWISSNIQYDYESFKNGAGIKNTMENDIVNETFKQKKAVCEGYSYLFKHMCDIVGVESMIIIGYSRYELYEAGMPLNSPTHAWNAVKINNRWKLLDATWASSKEYRIYYFLTPPEEFVVNHYPENKEWQLLEDNVSKNEFDSYPYISPEYFKLGFKSDYPKKGLIKTTTKGVVNLNISMPNDLEFMLKLYDYEVGEWVSNMDFKITRCEDKGDIRINLQKKGKYLLQVDVMRQDSGTYTITQGILGYTLLNE